ncbi:hypothetical protein J6590_101043 [Homalodisca vitripennis]|nr:hypothetical protein J6590_101043 [Homalodisca vitripennis]
MTPARRRAVHNLYDRLRSVVYRSLNTNARRRAVHNLLIAYVYRSLKQNARRRAVHNLYDRLRSVHPRNKTLDAAPYHNLYDRLRSVVYRSLNTKRRRRAVSQLMIAYGLCLPLTEYKTLDAAP